LATIAEGGSLPPVAAHRQLSPAALRRAMARRGLVPTELAELSGLGSSTIYKALSGGSLVPSTVSAIVRALAKRQPLDVPDDLLNAS
jgi:predicted transcriptional regulator